MILVILDKKRVEDFNLRIMQDGDADFPVICEISDSGTDDSTAIWFTPAEALELAAALSSAAARGDSDDKTF